MSLFRGGEWVLLLTHSPPPINIYVDHLPCIDSMDPLRVEPQLPMTRTTASLFALMTHDPQHETRGITSTSQPVDATPNEMLQHKHPIPSRSVAPVFFHCSASKSHTTGLLPLSSIHCTNNHVHLWLFVSIHHDRRSLDASMCSSPEMFSHVTPAAGGNLSRLFSKPSHVSESSWSLLSNQLHRLFFLLLLVVVNNGVCRSMSWDC